MPDGLDWIQWLIVGAILLGGLVRAIVQVVRGGEPARPGGPPPVDDGDGVDERQERSGRVSVWEAVEREREARAAAATGRPEGRGNLFVEELITATGSCQRREGRPAANSSNAREHTISAFPSISRRICGIIPSASTRANADAIQKIRL